MPVHYAHDPEKASPEWRLSERRRFPTEQAWSQEMEIDFSARAGRAVYTEFRKSFHVREVGFNPNAALFLCVDFNVSPMVWVVSQSVLGWEHVIDQIVQAPATVASCVEEFRNRWQSEGRDLIVCGDATGKGRSPQTGRSHYDLLEMAMRGWPGNVQYRVPQANPGIVNRIAAVNFKLRNHIEGGSGVIIDPRCTELIADLEEVVWNTKGTEPDKTSNPQDPYHWRTHASDAWGYKVCREWPTGLERAKAAGATRPIMRKAMSVGKPIGVEGL